MLKGATSLNVLIDLDIGNKELHLFFSAVTCNRFAYISRSVGMFSVPTHSHLKLYKTASGHSSHTCLMYVTTLCLSNVIIFPD